MTRRERLIVAISQALTMYAIKREEGAVPPSFTPHQFVLDMLLDPYKSDVTADIIDDVFAAVTHTIPPTDDSPTGSA